MATLRTINEILGLEPLQRPWDVATGAVMSPADVQAAAAQGQQDAANFNDAFNGAADNGANGAPALNPWQITLKQQLLQAATSSAPQTRVAQLLQNALAANSSQSAVLDVALDVFAELDTKAQPEQALLFSQELTQAFGHILAPDLSAETSALQRDFGLVQQGSDDFATVGNSSLNAPNSGVSASPIADLSHFAPSLLEKARNFATVLENLKLAASARRLSSYDEDREGPALRPAA